MGSRKESVFDLLQIPAVYVLHWLSTKHWVDPVATMCLLNADGLFPFPLACFGEVMAGKVIFKRNRFGSFRQLNLSILKAQLCQRARATSRAGIVFELRKYEVGLFCRLALEEPADLLFHQFAANTETDEIAFIKAHTMFASVVLSCPNTRGFSPQFPVSHRHNLIKICPMFAPHSNRKQRAVVGENVKAFFNKSK